MPSLLSFIAAMKDSSIRIAPASVLHHSVASKEYFFSDFCLLIYINLSVHRSPVLKSYGFWSS